MEITLDVDLSPLEKAISGIDSSIKDLNKTLSKLNYNPLQKLASEFQSLGSMIWNATSPLSVMLGLIIGSAGLVVAMYKLTEAFVGFYKYFKKSKTFGPALKVMREGLRKLDGAIADMFTGLQKLGKSALDGLQKAGKWAFEGLQKAGKWALDGLKNGFKLLGKGIQTVGIKLQKLKLAFIKFKLPIIIVAALIAALAAGIMYLWNNNEGFRDFVIGAWENIRSAFSSVIGFITGLFTDFNATISRAGEGIREFFTNIDPTAAFDIFKRFIPLIITKLLGGLPGLLAKGIMMINSIADGMGKRIDTTIKKQPSVLIAQYSVFIST